MNVLNILMNVLSLVGVNNGSTFVYILQIIFNSKFIWQIRFFKCIYNAGRPNKPISKFIQLKREKKIEE